MGGLQVHLPTQQLSVQQFLTKNSMILMPTLPIHLILPRVTFFLFCQMKKVLKGAHFGDVEEVKQIDGLKNCFEWW